MRRHCRRPRPRWRHTEARFCLALTPGRVILQAFQHPRQFRMIRPKRRQVPQVRRVRTAGLAAIALAVLLALLSYFIDTDKEKVAKRTRELITAVEKRDRPTLDRLLHPRASMLWLTKPEIIEKACSAADQYHLDNI